MCRKSCKVWQIFRADIFFHGNFDLCAHRTSIIFKLYFCVCVWLYLILCCRNFLPAVLVAFEIFIPLFRLAFIEFITEQGMLKVLTFLWKHGDNPRWCEFFGGRPRYFFFFFLFYCWREIIHLQSVSFCCKECWLLPLVFISHWCPMSKSLMVVHLAVYISITILKRHRFWKEWLSNLQIHTMPCLLPFPKDTVIWIFSCNM